MDIENHVPDEVSRSIPIKIKTYKNKEFDVESSYSCFGLKQNFFDPNKGSPPDGWTIRLLERIEKYGEKNSSFKRENNK
jgi:hypothetical protein